MTGVAAYRFSQLEALEAESIFIMREVVAEFERPRPGLAPEREAELIAEAA